MHKTANPDSTNTKTGLLEVTFIGLAAYNKGDKDRAGSGTELNNIKNTITTFPHLN